MEMFRKLYRILFLFLGGCTLAATGYLLVAVALATMGLHIFLLPRKSLLLFIASGTMTVTAFVVHVDSYFRNPVGLTLMVATALFYVECVQWITAEKLAD